jgi:hypothetical protein
VIYHSLGLTRLDRADHQSADGHYFATGSADLTPDGRT